jgi:dephospho-CoA kinase
MTFLLGLTGSIGMGKSATAAVFRRLGVPVHDADAAVHRLYRGAAVAPVEQAFPGTTRDGAVDRAALGARVLNDPEAMARLEAIIHPLVRADTRAFVRRCVEAATPLAVLDIPLLFETGAGRRVDAIVVVSAPQDVQKARVLGRAGMTPERFEAILARQLPDSQKRGRGHVVLDTSRGFDFAERQVRALVRALSGCTGRAARVWMDEV